MLIRKGENKMSQYEVLLYHNNRYFNVVSALTLERAKKKAKELWELKKNLKGYKRIIIFKRIGTIDKGKYNPY